MRKMRLLLLLGLLIAAYSSSTTAQTSRVIPQQLKDFVSELSYDKLGGASAEISYETISDKVVRVSLSWHLDHAVDQDDWQLRLTPAFTPDFHWVPHLTPTQDHIIAQHVFRAPALIVADDQRQLSILPDLEVLSRQQPVEWYMDLDAPDNAMVVGMSRSQVEQHVLFTRAPGAHYPPGNLTLGFYILIQDDPAKLQNPWREVLSFFWKNWGEPLYQSGEPLEKKDMDPYVRHTYNWAFNSWKEPVFQKFEIDGKKVGAPQFIVNVTQSPNYPGAPVQREFVSIWNQAWFNSLRSAAGLFRYARRTNNEQLKQYALLTKELALSFPQEGGFFPAVIGPRQGSDWSKYQFGNSNRNPYTWDPWESPLHILDMSFTALQMLQWYQDLEQDERLLQYTTRYGDALLELQDEMGFFPGWLDPHSLSPMHHLNRSPETSMSVTFLLKLSELTGKEKYRLAAFRALEAVMETIVPEGRWEDFETYWSCSRFGSKDLVGRKVTRNNIYKQNTLSMYWTAEALLEAYRVSGDRQYLEVGQRTLDELLMAQATWQPPFIHVNALGGFGVMNADAEWNDSRQSLFAPLIVEYGKELQKEEYVQRGLAALRAAFVMMYAPESPRAKEQWEKKWEFFDHKDYGFMMENYGHDGVTSPDGIGIGEFTIYDWGNGAASAAYNKLVDDYGKQEIISH